MENDVIGYSHGRYSCSVNGIGILFQNGEEEEEEGADSELEGSESEEEEEKKQVEEEQRNPRSRDRLTPPLAFSGNRGNWQLLPVTCEEVEEQIFWEALLYLMGSSVIEHLRSLHFVNPLATLLE